MLFSFDRRLNFKKKRLNLHELMKYGGTNFGVNLSLDSRGHPITRTRQLTSEARNRGKNE